jgi:class 3 adenylate cyclase
LAAGERRLPARLAILAALLITAACGLAGAALWLSPVPLGTAGQPAAMESISLLAVEVISGARPPAFAAALIASAFIACVACGLAVLVIRRSWHDPAGRQLAWILLAGAAVLAIRCWMVAWGLTPLAPPPLLAVRVADAMLFAYLLLAVPRFLVLFPRVVDTDSVDATYAARRPWMRWLSAGSRPNWDILRPWHAGLVSGKWLWLAPVLPFAVLLAGMTPGPFAATLGVSVLAAGWLFAGLPYAFASPTHLARFGTDDERRRVSLLRSTLLAFAAAFVLSVLAFVLLAVLSPAEPPRVISAPPPPVSLALKALVCILVAWSMLPLLLAFAVTASVMARGALHPRIAFTRGSLWALLGLAATLLFVLVERYVAMAAAKYLQLPPDTGAVVAGAAVAGTFMPLRNFASGWIERLANRFIPLQELADGERAARAVAIVDLSGYTALSATDEGQAILHSAALARVAHDEAHRRSGRVVKSLGDAVLLLLPDAPQAFAALQAIELRYRESAATLGLVPLPLHSALHWGEVVLARDGDVFGQTVNVTARLVHAAQAGQVIVSGAARDRLSPPVALASAGSHRFRNVPEPVDCYVAAGSP